MEKAGQSTEEVMIKKRFRHETQQPVEIIENDVYRARLEQLRALSTEINKKLDEKLDQVRSPYYSWNKGGLRSEAGVQYPKIFRLAVLLRPEFFKSDEEEKPKTRYQGCDDELTIFFHLTDDNDLQDFRFHSKLKSSFIDTFERYLLTFAPINSEDENEKTLEEKAFFRKVFKDLDIEALVDYFLGRLTVVPDGIYEDPREEIQDYYTIISFIPKEVTPFFQRAYTLSSVKEAQDYFLDEKKKSFVLHQSLEIIRNLVKVVFISVLEQTLKQQIDKVKNITQVRELLETTARDVLEIEIPHYSYSKTAKLGTFLTEDNFVQITIQQIIKAYKPRIMGWKKED